MPLPTFDTQDAIPEAFRGEYMEREGKWVPKALSDADNVAAQNRRLLDEKKKLEDQFKGVLGSRSADEVAEILSSHAKSEEERAKKAGEFDKILEKRLGQQLADLQPHIEAGKKAVEELERRTFADKVIEHGEAAGLNLKLRRTIIRTLREEGLAKLDGEDLVITSADGSKRSITPEDFFAKEFKKDYPEFYLGNGASGGGATTGADRRTTSNGGGTIAVTDTKAFLDNIKDIAAGKKKVVVGN